MTGLKFNSSTAKRGIIRLPDASTLQYPIKITAVQITSGTTFKVGLTPLYSAMDATGKILTYSHDVSGEIKSRMISVGDIIIQPQNAFDVWLFEEVSTETTPETSAAPLPPKAPRQRRPKQTESKPEPKENRSPKKDWSDSLLVSMLFYLIGCSVLLFALVKFVTWENSDRHRAFLVPVATDLFYYGETYETRTRGVAVLSIPLPITDENQRSYQEIECPLTLREYDLIDDNLVPVGDVDYARWFIYRTRLFGAFECEFSSNQNWQLINGNDTATTIGVLDIQFLFALKNYDDAG